MGSASDRLGDAARAARELARHVAGGWGQLPVSRRIEILRELGRRAPMLAGPVADQLLGQLRCSSWYRAEAAAALAELGDSYADRGYGELSRLLADWSLDTAADRDVPGPDRDGRFSQMSVAKAIAALGHRYRRQAADALRAVAAAYPDATGLSAATELGKLGDPWRQEAATALRRYLRPPERGWHGGRDTALRAALALDELGPQWRPQALAGLRGLAADPSYYLHRVQAVQALADRDPAARGQCLQWLADMAADDGFFETRQVREAVRAALALDADSGPRLAENLRRSWPVKNAGYRHHRSFVALAMTDLGPGYAAEAAGMLREVLGEGGHDATGLAEVSRSLAALGGADTRVDVAVRTIVTTTEDWEIADAAEDIFRLPDDLRAQAIRRLRADAGENAQEAIAYLESWA